MRYAFCNINSICLFVFLFFCIESNAQIKRGKILWDVEKHIPVQYATIKTTDDYTISNAEGYFEIEFNSGILFIQNISYEKIEMTLDDYRKKDTIFMEPKIYELEEVVITKDDRFSAMVRSITTDYALEKHKEKFFLRVIVEKNNELYKVVDFSGYLQKETLFGTKQKPLRKNNYVVQLDEIRKAGIENRTYDFALFSFNVFLERIASVYLSPKIYDFSYKNTIENDFLKIVAKPKDISETKTTGYYIVNNSDNTFNEVYLKNEDKEAEFFEKGNIKYRTIFFELKSNFSKNKETSKYQLNMAVLSSHTEVFSEDKRDFFEVKYIYYANPVSDTVRLKNNINLNKDMFELKGTYSNEYWNSQNRLLLTDDIQSFMNKLKNSQSKTSRL